SAPKKPPDPASAEGQAATPAPAKRAGRSWDGAALRKARENEGMTLQELSSRTKINVAILRALEEERFEETPKARVYVRGFVGCIAEELGLDVDAVTRAYVPRWEEWFAERPPDEYAG
ncbi:MAG: helix-turn-helix transcriptional regulator, partial [Myxococcota bacterium]